ncbi:MAG: triose-phosphate isomerase, partial [Marinomonas sp.]
MDGIITHSSQFLSTSNLWRIKRQAYRCTAPDRGAKERKQTKKGQEMRRKIAAGNWKMNGLSADLIELETLAPLLSADGPVVIICPPAPLLDRANTATKGSGIRIGAQDCHTKESGAFTGDLAAKMIADTGASYVIVGHSERRAEHSESDSDVRSKAETAWAAGLTAIICIGESLED